MYGYNANTDWTRNKRSNSIIYVDACGTRTEVTLEDFLADSPENTVKMFAKIKALSDEQFRAEDISSGHRAKVELSLTGWTEVLEARIYPAGEQPASYRHNHLLSLVPEILSSLTDVQRKRFFLHKVKHLTTRKIAAMQGVTHQSVVESLGAAEKKIAKALLRFGLNS